MTVVRRMRCEVRVSIPATLEALEEFFAMLRGNRLMPCAGDFGAELLLRETMTNAVVHGCRNDASKQVRCVLRVKDGRLIIAVVDDGEGFDWQAASRHRSEGQDISGRGMEILQAYSTRVRFNARGNAVAILKRL